MENNMILEAEARIINEALKINSTLTQLDMMSVKRINSYKLKKGMINEHNQTTVLCNGNETEELFVNTLTFFLSFCSKLLAYKII